MAVDSLVVQPGYNWDNSQKSITITGELLLSGTPYQVGGVPLDSVLTAIPEATGKLQYCYLTSSTGSGYIYQRIKATGTMMILQVPPSGSLNTAAPLQQLQSSDVITDTIHFTATYKRNSNL